MIRGSCSSEHIYGCVESLHCFLVKHKRNVCEAFAVAEHGIGAECARAGISVLEVVDKARADSTKTTTSVEKVHKAYNLMCEIEEACRYLLKGAASCECALDTGDFGTAVKKVGRNGFE